MKLIAATGSPFYLRNIGSAGNAAWPNVLLCGNANAAVVTDAGNYTASHCFYCTKGDNVVRMEVGHLDDGSTSLPLSQVASQVKAGVSALYLASRGNVSSSIYFYTGGGSSLSKRWEMNSAGNLIPGTNNAYDIGSAAGSLRVRSIYLSGTLVAGNTALATSATDGFLYIPSMNITSGTPTGTPTSYGSTIPIVYDIHTDKLYVYNGSWKSAVFS